MFNCRICTDSPLLSAIFGTPAKRPSRATAASAAPRKLRDPDNFKPRDVEETKTTVVAWEKFVHPRAREFFPSGELLMSVLTQLARGVTVGEDPVLAGENGCVHWYGEVTKDEVAQAAIRMVKPGEAAESVTFVNRVLVFIFATDESFEQLMKLPKEPFRMTCGDQLCVNLHHISTSI